MGLIHPKEKYVPGYKRFFIQLLADFTESIEKSPIQRVADGYEV